MPPLRPVRAPLRTAGAAPAHRRSPGADTLFLYGIVVGVLALFGLTLLLTGARRTSRRGREACRGLRHSRRETAAVSKHRDDLLDQRDAARAHTASTLENGSRWPRPSAPETAQPAADHGAVRDVPRAVGGAREAVTDARRADAGQA